MKKLYFLLLAFGAVISNAQTFRVSIADSLKQSALDGRLLLLLSKNDDAEPRFQINDAAHTQLVFGIDVNDWWAASDELVDIHAFGYPIERLKDVPAGDYYVQVLLHNMKRFIYKQRKLLNCRWTEVKASTGMLRQVISTQHQ